MKRLKVSRGKEKEAGLSRVKSAESARRDKETVELFTEILDRSCPRE